MVAGHFGFAAMVKSREKSAVLATAWLDVVFVPVLMAHQESVQPIHKGSGGLLIHADYTHSIVGVLALSVVLGAMFLPKLGRRIAVVIALVSASHWVLDLVVHRPDMPVLPGNAGNFPYLGLGLWNHPLAAACVELVLVVAGAAMYWRLAMEVSTKAGRNVKLASLSAAMIAALEFSSCSWITRARPAVRSLAITRECSQETAHAHVRHRHRHFCRHVLGHFPKFSPAISVRRERAKRCPRRKLAGKTGVTRWLDIECSLGPLWFHSWLWETMRKHTNDRV
jgi:membrane-bound metal-dependent hydrolase YbcI (DUF457 family)